MGVVLAPLPDQGHRIRQDFHRPVSHRGGWEPPGDFGAVAMPLDLALEHLSANPYFLELRQTYC